MTTIYTPLASALKPDDVLEWEFNCCNRKINVKRYWLVNIIAGCLHLVNALLMVIFYYVNDRHDQLYDITSTYGSWERIEGTPDDDPKFKVVSEQATIISSLSLNWLIFTFHILSFIFQIGALLPCFNYRKRVEKEGRNPLRFIEYSLSASIMLICIALLTGIRDFVVLLSMSLFTMLCQFLGLVGEYMTPGSNRNGVHGLAWVSIMVAYGIIIYYYVLSIVQLQNTTACKEDLENAVCGPPDYVHVIIAAQAALFLSFGVVQTAQFYGTRNRIFGAIGRQAEISYCVLSLVAKTILGWLIYANVIVNPDN